MKIAVLDDVLIQRDREILGHRPSIVLQRPDLVDEVEDEEEIDDFRYEEETARLEVLG